MHHTILVFSFVGFNSQEIQVGTQTQLNVTMELSSLVLQEVVVTGYTSQSKELITGSVAVVDVEQSKKVPAMGVEEMMLGTAPGVFVGQSGAPGGSAIVRIRGYGSLRNNNPLYIIDGVPTEFGKYGESGSGLNVINPNDVESIQVLKDASAASVYGSRAANGVVIITTKKGSQKGAPRIAYNGYAGAQIINENNFPQYLTPQQQAEYIFEAQMNAFGTFNHPQYGDDPNGPVEVDAERARAPQESQERRGDHDGRHDERNGEERRQEPLAGEPEASEHVGDRHRRQNGQNR